MLTKVIVQTSTPVTFNVESVDPDEILVIKSISGLSRAGAELFTGEFARSGGYYQGRRAKKRSPLFNFRINPNYEKNILANDVRELLYRTFMEPSPTSDRVQVALFDDKLPERYLIGYTEDIEADMWNKEVSATVSMVTTDPFIRSAEEKVDISLSGWYNLPITYEGTAKTGLELHLRLLTNASRVIIRNNDDKIEMVHDFMAGDNIILNTSEGSLRALVNGQDRMGTITGDSKWLQLAPGLNVVSSSGPVSGDGRAVITGYKYRAAWWGV